MYVGDKSWLLLLFALNTLKSVNYLVYSGTKSHLVFRYIFFN